LARKTGQKQRNFTRSYRRSAEYFGGVLSAAVGLSVFSAAVGLSVHSAAVGLSVLSALVGGGKLLRQYLKQ